jgi:phage terminase small subunit
MTRRQRRFVEEYLIDGDAAAAARRAGYAPRSAETWGRKLLRHPAVAAALGAREGVAAERLSITAERVLRQYARIAFADLRRIADWDGDAIRPRPAKALRDDDVAAIAEMTLGGAGGRSRVKLYDKKWALEGLARHLGLLGPRRLAAALDIEAEGPRAQELILERLARLAEEIAAEPDAPEDTAGATGEVP